MCLIWHRHNDNSIPKCYFSIITSCVIWTTLHQCFYLQLLFPTLNHCLNQPYHHWVVDNLVETDLTWIFNKDERKSLARKNVNESPIWSWNDSTQRYIVFHWCFCSLHIYRIRLIYTPILSKFECKNCTIAVPIQYSRILPLVLSSIRPFFLVHIWRIACIIRLYHT